MSRGDAVTRGGLVLVGVVVAAYGAYLTLSRQTEEQIVSTVQYLVGGVVLNDLLIAVAALLVGLLVIRFLPVPVRAPVAVGSIVLGSVTLLAVPVLLAYGRKPDNPTLLDRDFRAGWLGFAVLVVVTVVVASVVRLRAARASEPTDA